MTLTEGWSLDGIILHAVLAKRAELGNMSNRWLSRPDWSLKVIRKLLTSGAVFGLWLIKELTIRSCILARIVSYRLDGILERCCSVTSSTSQGWSWASNTVIRFLRRAEGVNHQGSSMVCLQEIRELKRILSLTTSSELALPDSNSN